MIAVSDPVGHCGGLFHGIHAAITSDNDRHDNAGAGPLGSPEPEVRQAIGEALAGDTQEGARAGKCCCEGNRNIKHADVTVGRCVTGGVRSPLAAQIAQNEHGNNINDHQYDKDIHGCSPFFSLLLFLVGHHDIDDGNQHDPRTRLKNQPML